MNKPISAHALLNVYVAIKTVLQERNYLVLFLLSLIGFFALFIVIPLITIPGNDLIFQLKIFRTRDYFLMTFLAVLVGLNLALQVYSFKQRRTQQATQSVAGGAVSGVAGMFAAIIGTAACASCLASLFALVGLGTGSVFFVLRNQSYFLGGAIIAMLALLYVAARSVNRVCTSC